MKNLKSLGGSNVGLVSHEVGISSLGADSTKEKYEPLSFESILIEHDDVILVGSREATINGAQVTEDWADETITGDIDWDSL